MKIRYVAVAFALVVIAMLTVNICLISESASAQIDMTSLNASYKAVLSELALGRDADAIEAKYGCGVVLYAAEDYERRVMTAIKERRVILDYMDNDRLLGKIIFDGENEKVASLYSSLKTRLIISYACILVGGGVLLFTIYLYYVRPFGKLKGFAASVAKGDLDAPLEMQKRNFFGVFTESFDIMREELKRAKENEYRANMSKKELVAELSHDMKTPVATIKATCDVLKVQFERRSKESASETERTLEKISIIEQKANMIDELISNMFHASLEDMETLKVSPESESASVVVSMFEELKYFGNINIKNAPPECLVLIDRLRLKQVIDNVVNNSYKYAGTVIDVSFIENESGFVIEIRDHGAGVSEEELPLVCEKYYRGENGKGKNGAGLGLFIANYFMKHMSGDMECHNDDGFVVNLFLRKAGIPRDC